MPKFLWKFPAGHRSVWAYRFDWDEEQARLGVDLSRLLGAAHGFELPFVFGHFDLGRHGTPLFADDGFETRDALSRTMMSYWAELAWSGDPGGGRELSLPRWTAYPVGGDDGPRMLVFDTAAGGGVRMSPEFETRTGVLAAVASDASLRARDRCLVYAYMADWGFGLRRSEYASDGREACAAFALPEGRL